MSNSTFASILSHFLVVNRAQVFEKRMARPIGLILSDLNLSVYFKTPQIETSDFYKAITHVACTSKADFETALTTIPQNVNVIIVSIFGSLLTSFVPGDSGVRQHAVELIRPIHSILLEFAAANKDTTIFVAPPPYRRTPLWYRDGLYMILYEFNQLFRGSPSAIQILPAFPQIELTPDGFTPTPVSAINYLVHIEKSIEQYSTVLPWSDNDQLALLGTKHSSLDQQVQALQQDHIRLRQEFEIKTAIDAELDDWHENEKDEICTIVTGLKRLTGNMDSREFQKVHVQRVQQLVDSMFDAGSVIPAVKFVKNLSGNKDSMTIEAHFESPKASKFIRDRFARFYRPNPPPRPAVLKDINMRNKVNK